MGKDKRCGGQVMYQSINGMPARTITLCGPDMYNAKCTLCGHQWQDAGGSRACPALADPPKPKAAIIPDPPYGLVFGDGPGGEVYLTDLEDGLEIWTVYTIDLTKLVVVSREYLKLLEGLAKDNVPPTSQKTRPPYWVIYRGTKEYPCEGCGQNTQGNTFRNDWYHCNACGYPLK